MSYHIVLFSVHIGGNSYRVVFQLGFSLSSGLSPVLAVVDGTIKTDQYHAQTHRIFSSIVILMVYWFPFCMHNVYPAVSTYCALIDKEPRIMKRRLIINSLEKVMKSRPVLIWYIIMLLNHILIIWVMCYDNFLCCNAYRLMCDKGNSPVLMGEQSWQCGKYLGRTISLSFRKSNQCQSVAIVTDPD